MMVSKEFILSTLKELKPKYEKEGFVILGLFGSYARGEETENSDVDVAIKMEKDFLSHHDVWSYFHTLNTMKEDVTKILQTKCDIFDIESPSSFVEKVKKEVLYV